MRLEYDIQDIDKLADSLAPKVAEILKPLLKSTRGKDGDTIFTVETLSDYIHVPTKKIYSMTHLKEIPYFKVGNGLRFRKSEIDSWLQESYTPAVNSISKHFQGRMAK